MFDLEKLAVKPDRYLFGKIRYPHFTLKRILIFWPIHMAMFFITEHIYPREAYHPVQSSLDALIPFHEAFVIPYVAWYVLLAVTALYFVFTDSESCDRFHTYLLVLDIVMYSVYFIYPTYVPFQPEEFPRDNLLTDLVALIYGVDEPSSACPSFHVAYSLAVATVWLKRKQSHWWTKSFIVILVALICLATVFLKQHSVLDFFWALPVCLLAEIIAYGKNYWKPKFKKQLQSAS